MMLMMGKQKTNFVTKNYNNEKIHRKLPKSA